MSEESQAEKELKLFFYLFEKDATFKLKDVEGLKDTLSKAIFKIEELRISRDKWRAKANGN